MQGRGDRSKSPISVCKGLCINPINNVIMLMLGLPFILSRQRNIKASALLCVLIVAAFFGFIYVCRYIDLPPFWAANLNTWHSPQAARSKRYSAALKTAAS